MQIVNEKSKCCGCTACVNSCPLDENAISLSFDEEGFLYPVIDTDKCIECHACVKACFYHTGVIDIERISKNIHSYAVVTKDTDLLNKSQSGGAFGEIARVIIEQKGVIYGAAVTDDGVVEHQRIEAVEELYKLHGSKYVQSQMKDAFFYVKKDLQLDRWVLFSGTPCQIMGLRKYLKKEYSNLVLVDIVCYGVPSPKLWEKFLESYVSKSKEKIKKIVFREKRLGWKVCKTVLEFANHKIVTDGWTRLWGGGNALRPSCYQCKFSNLDRPGDLTIGDCWGIEKVYPNFVNEKGVSLLIANTKMGEAVFDKLKNNVDFCKVDINSVLQPRLVEPTKQPKNREYFWCDYKSMESDEFFHKYTKKPIREIVRNWISTGLNFIYQLKFFTRRLQ